MVQLKQMLLNHPKVKTLEFHVSTLDEDEFVRFLADASQFELVSIGAVFMNYRTKAARAVARAMQESKLMAINLSHNNIGPLGAYAIASAIRDSGIKSINLRNTGIGAAGAVYISHAICSSPNTITTLSLCANAFRDFGAMRIAEAIPHTALEVLDLQGNVIRSQGMRAICKAVLEIKSVKELRLSSNPAQNSMEFTRLICKIVEQTGLELLAIEFCNIQDAVIPLLANAIKKSSTLHTIKLMGNANISNIDPLIEATRGRVPIMVKTITLEQTRVSAPKRDELKERLRILHCERTKTMITLCSVYDIERLGYYTTFTSYPKDLLRRLARFL
jgi:Ran GTPase-activating protein (RanGAP) involved in mRNA processing and transport